MAKADSNFPPEQFRSMLGALLEERFKLVVHNETREQPIYALVMARSDGKLGSHLRRATVDCDTPGNPPPPLRQSPDERPPCGMRQALGRMLAGGVPPGVLAGNLARFVNRTVVDRTGLPGNFDLELEWTPEPEQLPQRAPGTPADQPLRINGADVNPNGPSLFTALQEQLGLKLESARGPVDVLVVDHAEHPTPD